MPATPSRHQSWSSEYNQSTCLQLDLDTKLDVKRELNVFTFDPEFERTEAEWAAIRAELLGESSGDEGGEGEGGGDEDEDESSEEEAPPPEPTQVRACAAALPFGRATRMRCVRPQPTT